MPRLHRTIPIAFALSFVGHAALLAAVAWPEGEPGGSGGDAPGSRGAAGFATAGTAGAERDEGAWGQWTVALVDGPPLDPAPPAEATRADTGRDHDAASAATAARTPGAPSAPTAARTPGAPSAATAARTPSAARAPVERSAAAIVAGADAGQVGLEVGATDGAHESRAGTTADSTVAALQAEAVGEGRGGEQGTAGRGERGAAGGHGPPGGWPGPGEVDRAARPRRPIRPLYPLRARRRGEESTVLIQAWVDESGDVAFSSVLESGGGEFDHSAQVAVHDSRFEPALQGGESVASRVALRIHFDLRD